ncbi:hypothetical protein BGZ93_008167 [Podila epicladia]|nr:hypothetical protein BGZ92_008443 [Podila epicladia]KAG0092801.1 hypothetical protein BGZ93_008167 [Podila epicladia]
MSLKQLPTAQFQLRNPYRLDRPTFDPIDVVETALADGEAQRQLAQASRPLPQPSKSTTVKSSDESNSSWHGVTSSGIKRIRDFQRRNSLREADKRSSKQQQPQPQSEIDAPITEANHSYFSQSWFGSGLQRRSSNHSLSSMSPKSRSNSPPPVPTITITHYIDSYAELTFERHVEWLTQTALWWDMPVVHLYPAPESAKSIEYVELAASRFASWVNFVKVPAGEENKLGPNGTRIKSISPHPKASKNSKLIKPKTTDPSDGREDEGGMVTGGQARRSEMTISSKDKEIEPMVGYVFVGSVDEQSQYHQVFETLQNLHPLLEIRYINSFEPHQQQSREQQELREDPCIHNLSWIHYWSAAKESQVLQSKIVNEVVRVRPMWVNNDGLHRNYTPPPPPLSMVIEEAVVNEFERAEVSFAESATLNKSSASIYDIFVNEDEETELRGVPSTVSVSSLLDLEDAIMEEDTFAIPSHAFSDEVSSPDHGVTLHTESTGIFESDREVLKRYQQSQSLMLDDLDHPPKRPSLSRTQSSVDVRHEIYGSISDLHGSLGTSSAKTMGRRSKNWTGKKSYCRSASTPALSLDHGDGSGEEEEEEEEGEEGGGMVSVSRAEFLDLSPRLFRRVSLQHPSWSASSTKSSGSLATVSTSSSGLGQRLAGFAQRLGVYKMRGTSLMVMDL